MSKNKIFYIKINSENIIIDIVDYQVDSYLPISIDFLPLGINGGWYKYENNQAIEIPDLNPNNIENRIQQEIDKYTEFLIESGLLH